MDSVLDFGSLTLPLLTGAFAIYEFMEFLRTRSLRDRVYYGDAFSADPNPSRLWNHGRHRLRHPSALLDESLTAARQLTANTLRSKTRWRPS